MDWSAGYVADIAYTYGYYPDLNPLRVRLAFLGAGLVFPATGTACELGFGQGLSVNMHAAASLTEWHGTDFNPSQAAYAQQLSAASGASASLYDQGFVEFCLRDDLPDFDYIGLHGIWSWISDENRAVIVDFLRRKLKVGGVVYVSYNTMPGWAAMLPMRNLLTQHADTMGAPGSGIVPRIDAALDFADRLMETNPGFARANPHVAERLHGMRKHNRNYLAHEYFNRDWHPMPFARMAEWLEPAKLSYACQATMTANIDAFNLSEPQQKLLGEINDPVFRESVRDFMSNQQFRKDYWVKGPRSLSKLEVGEMLSQLRIVLLHARSEVPMKTKVGIGEINMNEATYAPLYDALSDHQPRSLAQLQQQLAGAGVTFRQIVEATMLLTDLGTLGLAQDDDTIARSKPHTDRLNREVMRQARTSDEVRVLASPVIGGAIGANRFEQLFGLSHLDGHGKPEQMAALVWGYLKATGRKVVKDDKALESDEENLVELTGQAVRFKETQLPIWRALGILD